MLLGFEDLSTADSQRRLLAAVQAQDELFGLFHLSLSLLFIRLLDAKDHFPEVCVAIKTGSNAETQLPLRQESSSSCFFGTASIYTNSYPILSHDPRFIWED